MPLLTTAGTLAQKRNAAVARQVPTASFFPLSNTSVDPTYLFWRIDNPGYTFTPNVGITTAGPMTDASFMFFQNIGFNDPDISLWDTGAITDMTGMFSGATGFNQSLDSWDVSNVTTMRRMLEGCNQYNQPMNNWNTGSVLTMEAMFNGCSAFNQNIGSWDMGSVLNVEMMFNGCSAFNQNIGIWNTSRITNMQYMFYRCSAFNCGQASGVAHDLMQRTATGGWRVDSVVQTQTSASGMNSMFQACASFNGNLSNWCVTNITSAPFGFASDANANFTTARQPTWGACPFPG